MIFTYSLIFLQVINFSFKSHLELGLAFKKKKNRNLFYKLTKIGVVLYILVYIFTEAMFIVFSLLKIIENWMLRG